MKHLPGSNRPLPSSVAVFLDSYESIRQLTHILDSSTPKPQKSFQSFVSTTSQQYSTADRHSVRFPRTSSVRLIPIRLATISCSVGLSRSHWPSTLLTLTAHSARWRRFLSPTSGSPAHCRISPLASSLVQPYNLPGCVRKTKYSARADVVL